MIIGPASSRHLPTIIALRDEASAWLATRGIDQWRQPWPSHDAMADRIAASIDAGETWMVHDGGRVVATVAVDRYADPGLWTPSQRDEPAHYIHRLIVRRSNARTGIGAAILDWTDHRAASEHVRWLRIDVWTDNVGLQDYYRRRGFVYVRTSDLAGYPSGALFQRPVDPRTESPAELQTAERELPDLAL
jgi:GNAT superfamily N-acetyltransferase